MLRASYHVQDFHFVFPARTSRGVMERKTSWFLKLWKSSNPNVVGIGECSPLPGLSKEYNEMNTLLDRLTHLINREDNELLSLEEEPDSDASVFTIFPSSIAMALETAMLDLGCGGNKIIYKSSEFFKKPIPINGLIWMGDREFMIEQIEKKIALGFDCLKLKIGGLDFAEELEILSWLRSHFSEKKITLRLDANGAFRSSDVFQKLDALAKYDIHSIEQPMQPQDKKWPMVCKKSPIPIALDESLIGVHLNRQDQLLDAIKPKFIVLKPSLHGGFSVCREWIKKAERRKIGWWITSALESTIGLNAIAQFAALNTLSMPQGLGTGELYSDNFESPLVVRSGKLFYDTEKKWS